MKVKLNRKQKHFEKLLKEFDDAAQDWGWQSDQGFGDFVKRSKKDYEKTKDKLIKYVNKHLKEKEES